MYKEINQYKSIQEFAKTYTGKNGKPVSRQYIYELIESEKKEPGTTGIDVLAIGNSYFVKKAGKATQTISV